jgi:AraC-like DNA-binding protein
LSYCVDAAIGQLASRNPRRTLGLLSLALQEAGSVSALARSLGCERKTLQRYLAQERALPTESRDVLRCLSAASSTTTYPCGDGCRA